MGPFSQAQTKRVTATTTPLRLAPEACRQIMVQPQGGDIYVGVNSNTVGFLVVDGSTFSDELADAGMIFVWTASGSVTVVYAPHRC